MTRRGSRMMYRLNRIKGTPHAVWKPHRQDIDFFLWSSTSCHVARELRMFLHVESTRSDELECCSTCDENETKFENSHLEPSVGANIYSTQKFCSLYVPYVWLLRQRKFQGTFLSLCNWMWKLESVRKVCKKISVYAWLCFLLAWWNEAAHIYMRFICTRDFINAQAHTYTLIRFRMFLDLLNWPCFFLYTHSSWL